jgi:hypothetical protein
MNEAVCGDPSSKDQIIGRLTPKVDGDDADQLPAETGTDKSPPRSPSTIRLNRTHPHTPTSRNRSQVLAGVDGGGDSDSWGRGGGDAAGDAVAGAGGRVLGTVGAGGGSVGGQSRGSGGNLAVDEVTLGGGAGGGAVGVVGDGDGGRLRCHGGEQEARAVSRPDAGGRQTIASTSDGTVAVVACASTLLQDAAEGERDERQNGEDLHCA